LQPVRVKWRTIAIIGVLGIAAVVLRIWFATSRHTGIDSDEAIVGLMATRLLRHGELPGAFYWGQSYGGSLEAVTVVPFVWLFGTTRIGLRSASIVWELLSVWLTWRIALRLFSRNIAALVGALSLFWPLAIVWFGTRERGFYPLTALLGLGCVLLALQVDEQPRSWTRWAGFGLCAGVGWWTSPNIVYYVAPIGVWLLVRGGWRHWQGIALASAAALAGAGVWIVSSFRRGLASFHGPEVGRSSTFLERFRFFWTRGLPFAFGLRRPWSAHWYVSRTLDVVLYLAVLVLLVIALRHTRLLDAPDVFLLAFAPFVFAVLKVNYRLDEGRYTYFVASMLPLLLGRLVSLHIGRVVAAALIAVGTIGFVGGYQDLVRATPGSTKPLADELRREGYRTATGDYWSTYKMTFESNERVIASPLPGEPGARSRTYARIVAASNPVHVFNDSSEKHAIRLFEQSLREQKIPFRVVRYGWFEAIIPTR
jgi:4-amino-4-deoxy-L-arabinose transferase-like glycosyltransferase